MNIITDFLLKRRSTTAKKMLDGNVLDDHLRIIIECGMRVPDHAALNPWKVIVIKDRIRNELGKEFPLLFDSGIRGGSDIIRALALGADFVMLGRPLMYGFGADGANGFRRILDIIKDELSTALGLVGLTDINDISSEIIAKKFIKDMKY